MIFPFFVNLIAFPIRLFRITFNFSESVIIIEASPFSPYTVLKLVFDNSLCILKCFVDSSRNKFKSMIPLTTIPSCDSNLDLIIKLFNNSNRLDEQVFI